MSEILLAGMNWLVKVIGIGGCAFLALYVHDWGIPGAARIAIPQSVPIVGGFGLANVPILGDLTTGAANTFAADQVRIATASQTSICDAKLEKLVSGEELAAANARATQMQKQLIQAQQIKEEAETQSADLDRKAQEAQNELDKRTAADQAGVDGARWTDADVLYFRQSRQPKPGN
jgi:hypothetical protein